MTISNIIFKHIQAESQMFPYENISSSFHGDVSTLADKKWQEAKAKPPTVHQGFSASLGLLYFILVILLFHQKW